MSFPLAFLSLLIELAVGYPQRLFKVIGHPVTWIGMLIALLDRSWNHDRFRPRWRRLLGIAALLCALTVAILAGAIVERGFALVPFGVVGTAVVASSLI